MKLSSLWRSGSDSPSFLLPRHNNRSTESKIRASSRCCTRTLHWSHALRGNVSCRNFWIIWDFSRFFRNLLLFFYLLPVHVVIYPPTFRRHSPQFERCSSWPRRLWAVLSAFSILRLACVESWSRSLCRRTGVSRNGAVPRLWLGVVNF